MENRSIWALHGLTGYFIAVGLLLGILAYLTAGAISIQQATAQQAYEIVDPLGIKMKAENLGNEKHIKVYGSKVAGDVLHDWQFVKK